MDKKKLDEQFAKLRGENVEAETAKHVAPKAEVIRAETQNQEALEEDREERKLIAKQQRELTKLKVNYVKRDQNMSPMKKTIFALAPLAFILLMTGMCTNEWFVCKDEKFSEGLISRCIDTDCQAQDGTRVAGGLGVPKVNEMCKSSATREVQDGDWFVDKEKDSYCQTYYQCMNGVKIEKSCSEKQFDLLKFECVSETPFGCHNIKCKGKEDGMYMEQDGMCQSLYECRTNDYNPADERYKPLGKCKDGLYVDEYTMTCTNVMPSNCTDARCVGKEEGIRFPVDGTCHKFGVCNSVQGKLRYKEEYCDKGSFYDEQTKKCVLTCPASCKCPFNYVFTRRLKVADIQNQIRAPNVKTCNPMMQPKTTCFSVSSMDLNRETEDGTKDYTTSDIYPYIVTRPVWDIKDPAIKHRSHFDRLNFNPTGYFINNIFQSHDNGKMYVVPFGDCADVQVVNYQERLGFASKEAKWLGEKRGQEYEDWSHRCYVVDYDDYSSGGSYGIIGITEYTDGEVTKYSKYEIPDTFLTENFQSTGNKFRFNDCKDLSHIAIGGYYHKEVADLRFDCKGNNANGWMNLTGNTQQTGRYTCWSTEFLNTGLKAYPTENLCANQKDSMYGFQGKIKDVNFWRKALDKDEVKRVFKNDPKDFPNLDLTTTWEEFRGQENTVVLQNGEDGNPAVDKLPNKKDFPRHEKCEQSAKRFVRAPNDPIVYFADEKFDDAYGTCEYGGIYAEHRCPEGLYFNRRLDELHYESDAYSTETFVCVQDKPDNSIISENKCKKENGELKDDGKYSLSDTCKGYYECISGKYLQFLCPSGLFFQESGNSSGCYPASELTAKCRVTEDWRSTWTNWGECNDMNVRTRKRSACEKWTSTGECEDLSDELSESEKENFKKDSEKVCANDSYGLSSALGTMATSTSFAFLAVVLLLLATLYDKFMMYLISAALFVLTVLLVIVSIGIAASSKKDYKEDASTGNIGKDCPLSYGFSFYLVVVAFILTAVTATISVLYTMMLNKNEGLIKQIMRLEKELTGKFVSEDNFNDAELEEITK